MLRLPVSGLHVNLLPPTGLEDVMLLEAPALDLSLALALLDRVVRPHEGRLDPGAMVVTDYEAILLGVHRDAFGSQLKADLICGAGGCGSRAEVSFEIGGYLSHNRPRLPQDVTAVTAKSGWFQIQDDGIPLRYRLPTAGDLVAVQSADKPEMEVLHRCVDGRIPGGKLLRKLEKAMEAQAPSLSGPLQAECPGCGAELFFFFDVQSFVLQELRDQAAFVYQDTHLLALNYHWTEAQILEMPRHRRMFYAEMLRGQG
jgi:hypothetical protein